MFNHNTSTETLSPTNTACDVCININEKIAELLTSLFPSWPGHYSDQCPSAWPQMSCTLLTSPSWGTVYHITFTVH